MYRVINQERLEAKATILKVATNMTAGRPGARADARGSGAEVGRLSWRPLVLGALPIIAGAPLASDLKKRTPPPGPSGGAKIQSRRAAAARE